MLTALLYVSRSKLRLPGEAMEVDRIVNWASDRNAQLDITGALVFTERNFVQFLEGPPENVETLMRSIRRDPRHEDVDIIFSEAAEQRRFETWALAYAGPSTFVAGNVLPVADPGPEQPRRKAADRLIFLMRQFVEAHLVAQRRNAGGG